MQTAPHKDDFPYGELRTYGCWPRKKTPPSVIEGGIEWDRAIPMSQIESTEAYREY